MSDLTRVKAEVAIVFPDGNEIRDYVAAADIEAGQPVYIDSNGKVNLADADDAAAEQFRGIALKSVAAGQAVSVLHRGVISGTGSGVTGLAYDASVYVSDTAGELADAAGTTSLLVGHVVPIPDKDKSKALYITGWAG
jgi:predicted RecA/RadA family phage recombinase